MMSKTESLSSTPFSVVDLGQLFPAPNEERSCKNAVHGSLFQVHENNMMNVASTCCFVVVQVDLLEVRTHSFTKTPLLKNSVWHTCRSWCTSGDVTCLPKHVEAQRWRSIHSMPVTPTTGEIPQRSLLPTGQLRIASLLSSSCSHCRLRAVEQGEPSTTTSNRRLLATLETAMSLS